MTTAATSFDDKAGEPRPYKMMLTLGAPGAGKTSLVEETIARYRATHPRNSVVIVDPNNQFPGLGIWPEDADVETWLRSFKTERAKRGNPPALLVLDDADKFLTGGPPSGIWRDLFTSFRHWRVDVILNARRTQDVPKVVVASSQTLAIFIHREVHGRDYLLKQLGVELLGENASRIPRERFKYLLVDVDAGIASDCQTKRRAVVVAADRR